MTLPRTVADVLSDHVRFEVECIDRMYLNVWQPRLAYGGGVAGFFTGHRGYAYASTALMDPMSKAFVADIHHFVAARGVDLVHFGKGSARTRSPSGCWRTSPAPRGCCTWAGRRRSRTCGGPSAATTPMAGPTPGWCGPRRSSTSSTSIASMRTSARSSSSSAPTSPTPPSCASTAMSGPSGRPPGPGSASRRWTTGSPPWMTWRAAGDLRQPRPGPYRRAAAQVAGDSAQPVHRGGPGRRIRLRAVDPAGGVLPHPDAGRTGGRADLLRAGHARQPRHRPP